MESKSIFQSKTAALAALTVALGLIPGAKEFVAEHPDISLGILAVAQLAVRFLTKSKVTLFGN